MKMMNELSIIPIIIRRERFWNITDIELYRGGNRWLKVFLSGFLAPKSGYDPKERLLAEFLFSWHFLLHSCFYTIYSIA